MRLNEGLGDRDETRLRAEKHVSRMQVPVYAVVAQEHLHDAIIDFESDLLLSLAVVRREGAALRGQQAPPLANLIEESLHSLYGRPGLD